MKNKSNKVEHKKQWRNTSVKSFCLMIWCLITSSCLFVWICFGLLFNDSFKLQLRLEGRFLYTKEAGHCSSTKGTGFHILLGFILVKQFSSQIEHVISSLLNFPVILSPQVFMLPPIYFWVSSLKMWEGTRIFIKYHVPCTCHLDSKMKGQNSQPK